MVSTNGYRLKITNCSNHLEEITLNEGSYKIGRLLEATLRLESSEVSRLHARLLIGHTVCEIIDENSTNGTFVNGSRVSACRLKHGDKIQIGKFNLELISPKLTSLHSDIFPEDDAKKSRKFIYLLLAAVILATGFFVHKNFQWKKLMSRSQVQLASATAFYLAERNKEALYLGEYTNLNLQDLDPQIKQIAVVDRHGKIRAFLPNGTEPLIEPKTVTQMEISEIDKKTLEIYTPIFYNAIQVGTLWILYEIYP